MNVNLIEYLGGYEKAKAFLEVTEYTIDELLMMQRTGIRNHHVEKALLAYRREHNIFEIGDMIVSTLKDNGEFWKSAVCSLVSFHKKTVISESGGHVIHHYDFRHATDEEIKAGHRL